MRTVVGRGPPERPADPPDRRLALPRRFDWPDRLDWFDRLDRLDWLDWLDGRGIGFHNLVSVGVAASVTRRADDGRESALDLLAEEIVACAACPRLVEWREHVAVEKRAAYREQQYWGRPVPGFGDPRAWLAVVGLAPAAHGANRTGRMFTGDRSGDVLYAALHRAGLANLPTSTASDDGLVLSGAWVTAAVRCAPPGNRPSPQERDRCRAFLGRELALLGDVRVVLALGGFAYEVVTGLAGLRPRPRFTHGLEVDLPDGRHLLCSYHVSQQNTFTGRLTPAMLDQVLHRAAVLAVGS